MGGRVVVCDDEAHIQRAIEMKLSKAGIDVQTASDGLEAWQLIQADPPDVVVTDLQMPRMDGLELVRRMREEDRTAATPVILLTAKGFEVDEQQLRQQLGIDTVVVKPFSPRELLRTVQGLLEEASPASEQTCSLSAAAAVTAGA